jgi:hypothetical protein
VSDPILAEACVITVTNGTRTSPSDEVLFRFTIDGEVREILIRQPCDPGNPHFGGLYTYTVGRP